MPQHRPEGVLTRLFKGVFGDGRGVLHNPRGRSQEELLRRAAVLGERDMNEVLNSIDPQFAREFAEASPERKEDFMVRLHEGQPLNKIFEGFRMGRAISQFFATKRNRGVL